MSSGDSFVEYFTDLGDVDQHYRNDSTKQGSSTQAAPTAPTSQGRPSFNRGSMASGLSWSRASTNRSSLLRLTTSETNELEQSVETLKDLFWTLYSKLDAVLQGFRVAYEVAVRITEVS